MIERLQYALRWLRTQWRYRHEVRAWGWADPEHGARTEQFRREVLGTWPPVPVEVGYMMGDGRYRYRDHEGNWRTRDTREIWFTAN